MTVREYVERRWWRQVGQQYRPNTQRGYRSMLGRYILPRLGDRPLDTLTRLDVRGMLIALLEGGLSRASTRLVLAVLSNVLAAAIDDGLLEVNVCQTASRRLLRTREKTPETMSAAQVALFLATAAQVAPRFSALFALLAKTGLRIGEALALRVEDVNLDARWLHVARTYHGGGISGPSKSQPRRVDLSQDAVAILRKRIAPARPPECYLFRGRLRSPYRKETVGKAFRKVIVAAGLPARWTPHAFRHSAASRLISAGVSPAFVQRLLGHADITTTMRVYGSGLPYRDLLAVDRLDQLPETP